MMAIEKKLDDNYRDYCFNRNELEILLGFDLDINELPDLKNQIELITNLPEELKPFLSRKTIQLKEAANIMAGYKPFYSSSRGTYYDDVQGYRAALWDAVDNDILVGKNIITQIDFGQEWREDITLNKNEVTKWANKYNFKWSLPIDTEINETNHDNSELLNRINQLEQELAEQKKSNSDVVTIPVYDLVEQDKQSSQDNRVDDLEDENRRLEKDFRELNSLLIDAKKEIEELKGQVPILLGKYRNDDPLLLAIQIRNKEWANYDDNNKRTRPSQDAICTDLKNNYNVKTDQLAKAIELVSCPIDRSK